MAQVLRANPSIAQSLPATLAKSLTSVGTLVAQRTIVAMLSPRTITKHSIAAAMLLLAAATGLIVPCLCPPATAASHHTDDHSCCEKEAGIQAADATCCSDPGLPTSTVTWTAADSVILATPGSGLYLTATSFEVGVPRSTPPQRPVSASPPLRI